MARPDPAAAAFAFLVERVLEPGETLRWTGRPSPRAAARVAGDPQPVAALVLLGVVLWLAARALMEGELLVLILVVLAVGLWVVATPWRHRWRARHLYYAITDRRALVVEANFGLRAHALPPGPYEREDHADGTASFQPQGTVAGLTGGLWGVADPKGCAAALAGLSAAPPGS